MSTAVCVAGMHRSGTSLVTRLLNLHGVYLGADDEIDRRAADNPQGFWEHPRFVSLNEDVLNSWGGAWDLPVRPDNWRDRKEYSGFKRKALMLSRDLQASAEIWGWKDPRNSLTLPLWLDVIPSLKVIICVRNPLEVAVSLNRRGLESYAAGLNLWAVYNERLLDDAPADRRIVTHFEAFFANPCSELRRLLQFVGVPCDEELATETVVPALRHARYAASDLVVAGVSDHVAHLYSRLLEEAGASADSYGEVRGPETAVGSSGVHGGRSRRRSSTLRTDWIRSSARRGRPEAELYRTASKPPSSSLDSANGRSTKHPGQLGPDAGPGETSNGLAEAAALSTLNTTPPTATSRGEAAATGLSEPALDNRPNAHSLAHDALLEHWDQAQTAIYRHLFELERKIDQQGGGERDEYSELLFQIRQAVLTALPRSASICVVSKGDDRLLTLPVRSTQHFPQDANGGYAGYYPADSLGAVANLETARADGAQFLIFPRPSWWWLETYAGFADHLQNNYREIEVVGGSCRIYDLRASNVLANWQAVLDASVRGQTTRGEAPSLLDCDTGLDLKSRFPGHAIFSPPSRTPTLPYLDGTIDIVVWNGEPPTLRSEVYRVARNAVISVEPAQSFTESTVSVEWLMQAAPASEPTVSIIIPCYDNAHHTERCLKSLTETLPTQIRVEVIVVDDGSDQSSYDRVQAVALLDRRIRVLRNELNLGYLASVTRGAQSATGTYLLFLNNDTVLLPGWLPPLLDVFQEYEDAGVVGGKLIYPDGRLQEAGGFVFADGSAAKFGYGDAQVDAPPFNHVRVVDYCSGCLLMTPRQLFESLGGFDERYAPGYYEDTDYCFRVRDAGYQVYYQPDSRIVHVEGGTAGTSVSVGMKRYQVLNQAKFAERWAGRLQSHSDRPMQVDTVSLMRLLGTSPVSTGGQ